jgi:hypothetical protein
VRARYGNTARKVGVVILFLVYLLEDSLMKRIASGWVVAAVVGVVLAPGCAENNEKAVTSGSGTTVAKPPEGGTPRSPADIAKIGQESASKAYKGTGYPGAPKK